jgi:hypothetical protein
MTRVREDDGSLSKLTKVTPWLDGLFVCVRENGRVIIASPEDLVDDEVDEA